MYFNYIFKPYYSTPVHVSQPVYAMMIRLYTHCVLLTFYHHLMFYIVFHIELLWFSFVS